MNRLLVSIWKTRGRCAPQATREGMIPRKRNQTMLSVSAGIAAPFAMELIASGFGEEGDREWRRGFVQSKGAR
jgi:hypothetical protein